MLTLPVLRPLNRFAQKKSAQRLQIEAVLQEYLQSERVINCSTRIKSQLKRDIVNFTEPHQVSSEGPYRQSSSETTGLSAIPRSDIRRCF